MTTLLPLGPMPPRAQSWGLHFYGRRPSRSPMMVAVVYLTSKVGLVSGEGLFAVIRRRYSRPFLFTVPIGVLIGNTIEAGAIFAASAGLVVSWLV